MPKQFYTTHEASKLCNVYPTTVINWINEDILPAFATPGGHRRIKKEDLIALMEKNRMPIPEELLKDGAVASKVLVIDDDLKITKMIKTILEAEGIEVVTAKSGFGAGLIVSEWRPDVILLDFLMPEVDGFEVTRILRMDEKTKNVPIIAVTVLRGQKEVKKMYDGGITDYLSKPFKAEELVSKVKKYVFVHN